MANVHMPAVQAAPVDAHDSPIACALAERDAALEDAEFLREYMDSARAYLAYVAESGVPDESELAILAPAADRHPTRLPLGTVRNQLLAALSPDDLGRLAPHLAPLRLRAGETLFEPEAPIRYVYFPETAVVSLVSRLGGRGSVEVGTAGYEGMVGLPLFLSADTPTSRAVAQIPGMARRMEAKKFLRLAGAPGPFPRTLLRYAQAFLTQVAQTAVCNASHLVEERCARWLLMTRDRVNGDHFPLTYEFLAFMLAVRTGGVMMGMRKLQSAGLIIYDRGRVSIMDRSGLEACACECYVVVRAHFDRLLPAGA